MCGIVGILTPNKNGFSQPEIDIFDQLLYIDALRGADSTGAFCVHSNMQVSGFKHAAEPAITKTSRAYNDFKNQAFRNGRILIGHNRKATHGTINNANSHPFYEDHIVLVHNGMVRGQDMKEHDVDSAAFAHRLSKTAPEDVPQLIADTEGAFVFIWWDMNQKKLFFTRNDERPLGIVEYNRKIVLSSEYWMAHGITHRVEGNSITRDTNKPGAFDGWFPKAGILYSYDADLNLEEQGLPAKKAVVFTHSAATTKTTTATQAAATQTGHTTPTHTNLVPFERKPVTSAVGNTFNGPVNSFRRGEKVVATIKRIQLVGTEYRAVGVISQLGKPDWDFSAVMPGDIDPPDLGAWQRNEVIGLVDELFPHLAAGPSVKLIDLEKSPRFMNTPAWNNKFFFPQEWEFIDKEFICEGCGVVKVEEYDRPFTSINFEPSGNLRCFCPDCVEERIKDEEIKTEFVKNRLAAMESGEQERKQPGGSANNSTQVEGPQTLQ